MVQLRRSESETTASAAHVLSCRINDVGHLILARCMQAFGHEPMKDNTCKYYEPLESHFLFQTTKVGPALWNGISRTYGFASSCAAPETTCNKMLFVLLCCPLYYVCCSTLLGVQTRRKHTNAKTATHRRQRTFPLHGFLTLNV